MTPFTKDKFTYYNIIQHIDKSPQVKYYMLGVNAMNLTENAIKVLEKRYLAKDENGNLTETPEMMFRRVAKTVASADKDYVDEKELAEIEERFYNLMTSLYFLPNSPTLMNAGRPLGQLSACFVLPIEDSMEGIFDSVKNAALIHKSGGGTGFSFSRLRPKGSSVKSTGGVASGPVSFMKVFNAATEAVKQGGTRRGANMGILRVDHPDILEFITCKQNNEDITNFNISVGITEEFMKAVEEGREYDLIDPRTRKKAGSLNAREVFDLMVEMAWKNGEPGIIFLDRLNRDNVTPELGEIESTNPCGEQPLLPYEACNLGSINLSLMLKETDKGPEVDFDKLREVVHEAVHFLDNVIDVNKYPLPEIDKMTRGTRKIGLGVMGWADMLLKLGIPYDSEEAAELAEKVMSFIRDEARKKSMELAEIKGVFPYFDKSIYKDKNIRMRNATTTTIAPTGTLSIIAGVSSGIEPLFAISFIKKVMDNVELVETNPIFKEVAKKRGFYSDELMKKIAQNKGSLHDIEEIPEDIRRVFVTAHDISPEWHVRMQAAFQKFTDNAVSKTVNLRHDATQEDVRKVFLYAYKLGCKGVTIYRDGSRESQVINFGKEKSKAEKQADTTAKTKIIPRPRPDITLGFTEKVKTGCGNLYITVNYDDEGICEVFTNTGRAGGCPSQSEATARLVSIALRSGIDAESIVEQLKGIRCPSTIRQRDVKVLSCPDAIGRLIEKVMNHQNGNGKAHVLSDSFKYPAEVAEKIPRPGGHVCPECGQPMEHESGCVMCRSCGYSKCG
jgi:ribonucleoside-diphosphate reductase alpha chain